MPWLIVVLACLGIVGCDSRPVVPTFGPAIPTSSAPPESREPTAPSASVPVSAGGCVEGEPRTVARAEWYEGTCHGWRVGAEDVLGGDAYDRNLQVDCSPELYGLSLETSGPPSSSHPTDLDIAFAAIPDGVSVEPLDKWACGSMGLSDHVLVNDASGGSVDITRSLEGTAWLVAWAQPGSVVGCEVHGRPAVCIDYVADGSGRRNDFAYVFVIEDGTLDPHGVILRLYSESVPLARLVDVATSIEAIRDR